MAITAYLQQYLSEISKLPDKVKSLLEEVKKLDDLNSKFINNNGYNIDDDDVSSISELIKLNMGNIDEINNIDDDLLKDTLENVKKKLNQNLNNSNKKREIVNKLYNIVDQEVNRLDNDLKQFENDMLEQNISHIKLSTKSNLNNNKLNKSFGSDLNMPIDPNEPTYCLCHQVSYGDMIMCDNLKCPNEWFHFGCVGLIEKPKGKWFCLECTNKKVRGVNLKKRNL